MERRNRNETVTSALFEGSGGGNVITTSSRVDFTATTALYDWTNAVKKRLSGTEEQFNLDSVTTEMDNVLPDTGDGLVPLQTNILLIAVLVVCFATLASVMAMCVCFLRRYCQKRRLRQSASELYQTTLVSKATSITGLNAVGEYYSTKVETKDGFSPIVVGKDKCEKSITCELGSGRMVESTPNMRLSKLDPLSPPCQVPSDLAGPIYFKMKNVLTSTPATTGHQIPTGPIDPSMSQSITSSPPAQQALVYSTAVSPTSMYSSALSNQQMQNSLPRAQQDLLNGGAKHHHASVRCMLKGPLTQSVSWFVPLDGIQREPLRHSIVEVIPGDVYTETQLCGSSSPNQQYCGNISLKNKLSPDSCRGVLHEDLQEIARGTYRPDLSEIDGNSNASTIASENAPLMKDKENVTPNASINSLPLKRARLKSSISDDHSPDQGTDSGHHTRSRSLSSPEDNTMWKQREDRPVLFLGSGTQ